MLGRLPAKVSCGSRRPVDGTRGLCGPEL